jgi:hypothetical protein
MSRKFLVPLLVAGAVSLGSCQTLTPADVSGLLSQVSAITSTVCRAVPTAAALVALINAGIGATAGGLATAFCQAFQTATPAKAARRFGAPLHARATYACAGRICGWRL